MTGALDLAARNDLHASLPCGDPDRSAAPHAPAVCLPVGLPSLPRSGVKGRCALMSARWAFGPPLSTTAAGMGRRHRSPRVGEERGQTSRHQAQDAAMEWSEQRGFWLISWPELEQDALELGWRYAEWRWFGDGPDLSWPA